MAQLLRLGTHWLQLELLPAHNIVDTVVIDSFFCALPYKAKKLVGQHAPTDTGGMVALVEQVEATHEMLHVGERSAHRTLVAGYQHDRPGTTRVSPEPHSMTLDGSTT
ncbi:hypothetical protein AAFF_G00358580 [Aldrovandia affinis]|uniref:SCAN box domain-containing protein n=1 Tax=Aldrovandia affinis TaxID=143900 RepID=A0AAD7T8Z1_9TELE|nr:hypothetical protein AAFF_G00358580 [Aldrovandia affinis]